jgi:hypothetical protein
MNTTQKLDLSGDAEGKSFADLHSLVLAEYKEGLETKSGTQYWSGIWASLAPSGNIYRRIRLESELMIVSEDLGQQLYDVASKSALVSGSPEERVEELLDALKNKEVKADPQESSVPGYPPLEEFFDRKVTRWFAFLVPQDRDEFILQWKHIILAIFVFLIQILAPIFIFIARWNMDTNYLKNPRALYERMTWNEAICLGPNRTSAMTTLLGTLFMVIVILTIRNDIQNEVEDVEKTKRMPGGEFWAWVGNTANLVCCIATTLATLLLFWSEDTPLGLVLDSMALLFVQQLDDISDVVFSYIGQDNSDWQRQCAWSSILLSQCPVRLGDLTNPEAKTLSEFWVIRFDANGRLLNSKGERCLTRLCRAPADETTSLEAAPEASPAMEGQLLYCRRGMSWRIPTFSGRVWESMWDATDSLLLILQIVQPILYFIVNDPCGEPVVRD